MLFQLHVPILAETTRRRFDAMGKWVPKSGLFLGIFVGSVEKQGREWRPVATWQANWHCRTFLRHLQSQGERCESHELKIFQSHASTPFSVWGLDSLSLKVKPFWFEKNLRIESIRSRDPLDSRSFPGFSGSGIPPRKMWGDFLHHLASKLVTSNLLISFIAVALWLSFGALWENSPPKTSWLFTSYLVFPSLRTGCTQISTLLTTFSKMTWIITTSNRCYQAPRNKRQQSQTCRCFVFLISPTRVTRVRWGQLSL